MRVLRSPDAPLVETEPAQRPITFEDLLTHRSGLTYGDFHASSVGRRALNVRRLEDVARRAGLTTGAIYGNFKNRDELFIAMSETYWPPNGSDFFAVADLRCATRSRR
jgi:CubicO group peptidase (beta-lactamase class C family)